MKNIWIINQYAATPDLGRSGRHFYLAKHLVDMGYQVTIISASNTHLLHETPVFEGKVYSGEQDGVNFIRLRVPEYSDAHSKGRVRNWFLFAYQITRLNKYLKDTPDTIIYSSPSLIGYLGAHYLAKNFKARLVFEVRDIWPLTLCELGGYSLSHPFIQFLQYIEKKAYKNSDAVISNLKNSYQHMITKGLKQDKFTWIPNGIYLTDAERPQPLRHSIKEQLPNNKFLVGYTGTLGLANCLGTFIEAAEITHNETEIHYIIVGNGREKSYLKELVRDKQLKNVTFIDAIPKQQIQSILSLFDASFLGAKKTILYKYGVAMNKLYDYLYAAKPIIYAIDSGDYKPISDAKAGIEIEPENAQQLADAILYIKNLTKKDRKLMGARGRELVLRDYEYSALANKLSHVI